MDEFTPSYLRSNDPPHRLRPRSAVTLMEGDDGPPPGVIERLVRAALRVLTPGE
jgi:hypothetical protein